MPYSNENKNELEERKFSSEELLSYPSETATRFYVPAVEMPGKKEIKKQLLLACETGNIIEVKRILEAHSISVNARRENDGSTLLMIAIEHGQMALADFLLKQSEIDVSLRNWNVEEETALHMAFDTARNFEHADYAMAKKLIKAGANINEPNILLYAWFHKNQKVAVKLILSFNACIVIGRIYFSINESRVMHPGPGVMENMRQQIKLSEQWEKADSGKCVGIELIRLCHRYSSEDLGPTIAAFLFGPNSLELRGFNVGYTLPRPRLQAQTPSPKPFTFLRELHSDLYNQKHVSRDKGQDQSSYDKENRYGRCTPGRMDTP